MPTGKSTEKSKGIQLDGLPLPSSSSFDKERAWDKLYVRLHPQVKGTNKRMMGWVAAAVLLIAATGMLWLTFPEKKAVGFEGVSLSATNLPANPELTVKATSTDLPEKKTPAVQIVAEKEERIILTVEDEKPVQQLIVMQQPENRDTAVASALSPPVTIKKKLPVVYNNEIVRNDITEEPSSGAGVNINVPVFRKNSSEALNKAEQQTISSEGIRNRWLPFNKSAKPKE